jgi:hypothetical protein
MVCRVQLVAQLDTFDDIAAARHGPILGPQPHQFCGNPLNVMHQRSQPTAIYFRLQAPGRLPTVKGEQRAVPPRLATTSIIITDATAAEAVIRRPDSVPEFFPRPAVRFIVTG